MPFSDSLQHWIDGHHSFVNEAFEEDMQGGRSLGPASGILWDAYPFLHHCPYTGLFAGLSLSGMIREDAEVYVMEYSATHGFVPSVHSSFIGGDWQNLSSEDWQRADFTLYTPCNFEPPQNPVDLRLFIGNKERGEGITLDTREWHYHSVQLSKKYLQHSWVWEGYCLVAVTFCDRPEHIAPFLRPCTVSGWSAKVDPHCLHVQTISSRLFDGRVALLPKSSVTLSVQDSTIKFSRPFPRDSRQVLRQISGVSPNAFGNFSCISGGCCRFTHPCDEADPFEKVVSLCEGEIGLHNDCGPCCHCDDYVDYYEKLRRLFDLHAELIERFSAVYKESVRLKEHLTDLVQSRRRFIRVSLGEWGEDADGFYCVFHVKITATETEKPPSSAVLTFTREEAELIPRSATMTIRSDTLSVTVSVGSQGIELTNIVAAYVGTRMGKLKVRFRTFVDISSFDPSVIKMTVHSGEV